MIRSLIALTLLLISIWIGLKLGQDPGYLLIAINHWTLETTLWVAIPCFILLFITLHILLLLLNKFIQLPSIWRQWQVKHKAHLAQEKTRKGLIEFSEGHWLNAKNHLINALPNADTPLFNYLTAARAAQEMGNYTLRDQYLREAQQSVPEAKIAVKLTQAQLQLANKQWEQALATLKHLQDIAPQHTYVLKLLMNLYEEIGDWAQLIALIPSLKKYKVITDEELTTLQNQAYLQTLLELIKQNQTHLIHEFMKKLPRKLMNNPQIISVYCRYLIQHNRDDQAEDILKLSLQKQFNNELINIYKDLKTTKNQDKLKFAQSLLKKHPHSANLYFCLATICQEQQLWGNAKIYFQKSMDLNPAPKTYEAFARLLEEMDEPEEAGKLYKNGLILANQ